MCAIQAQQAADDVWVCACYCLSPLRRFHVCDFEFVLAIIESHMEAQTMIVGRNRRKSKTVEQDIDVYKCDYNMIALRFEQPRRFNGREITS